MPPNVLRSSVWEMLLEDLNYLFHELTSVVSISKHIWQQIFGHMPDKGQSRGENSGNNRTIPAGHIFRQTKLFDHRKRGHWIVQLIFGVWSPSILKALQMDFQDLGKENWHHVEVNVIKQRKGVKRTANDYSVEFENFVYLILYLVEIDYINYNW